MTALVALFFLFPAAMLSYSVYRHIVKWRKPFKQIGFTIQALVILAGLVMFYGFIITQPDQRGMFIIIVSSAIVSILYSINAVELIARKWRKPMNWLAPLLYSVFTIGLFFFFFLTTRRWGELKENNPDLLDFAIGGFFTLMTTCAVIAVFQLFQDAIWIGKLIPKLRKKKTTLGGLDMDRSTFLTKTGLILGGLVFGNFLWGMTKGKFGWRILEEELFFSNLPDEFDGTTLVQISDLHLGSFNNNFEPLTEAVNLINKIEADYICFTGDLVNTYHTEAEDWIPVFNQLKAKEGKFSILGNHDYGYYREDEDETEEETAAAEAKCRAGVIEMNKKMGFDPLINEHRILKKDGASIAMVGVENWGESHWFPKAGDIKMATKGMDKNLFSVLLSHDPTHWDAHIVGKENIDLTLSGHTHGAQMGLRIPGVLEISPAALMFKRWAGLYEEGKQRLYINRGMGYLMIPGRIGMPPEITKITLRKG